MRQLNVLIISLDGSEELRSELSRILGETTSVRLCIREEFHDFSAEPRHLGGSQEPWAGFKPDVIFVLLGGESQQVASRACTTLQNRNRKTPLVVVTESRPPQALCELLDLGAADFLIAPLRAGEVVPRLLRLTGLVGLRESVLNDLKDRLGLQQIIGKSEALQNEIAKTPKIARCDASVLITGETGTGKEMFARAIHYVSLRSNRPFVPVNCGALPVELVENELFGHESGAFTGATASAPGMIDEAEGGTLFLDEVDSLPPAAQVKLLRFLQEKEYRPLGSRQTKRADVRVIAATNVNFEQAMKTGKFRSDLYYRLNVISFCIPPLRERREDIPLLALHFLDKHAAESSGRVKGFSTTAIEKLMSHNWPGNVREFENVIRRTAISCAEPEIQADDVLLPARCAPDLDRSFKTLKARAVAEFEAAYIRQELASHAGNISQAASAAKKNRRAFWELMRKHRIKPCPAQSIETSPG